MLGLRGARSCPDPVWLATGETGPQPVARAAPHGRIRGAASDAPVSSVPRRSADVIRPSPLALALSLVLAVASPTFVAAQEAGLAIEVAGGFAIPVSSLSSGTGVGEGVSAGPSLGVSFVSARSERVDLRIGFTQHRFGCSEAGCADPDEYVVTGLNLGLRASLFPGGPVDPWLSAALITSRAETPGLPAPNDGVSSTAFGAEVGTGLAIVAGRAVSLRPGVAWAFANPELPGSDELALRYLTTHLVIEIRF